MKKVIELSTPHGALGTYTRKLKGGEKHVFQLHTVH